MNKTRLSLFYVATYLMISGLGFTFFPSLSLRLMFSTGHYETTFVRVTGMFILGLSALVAQSVRYHLQALYPTLIGLRVFFCLGYLVLYFQSSDPLFLSFLAVVGLGLTLSVLGYSFDRKTLKGACLR